MDYIELNELDEKIEKAYNDLHEKNEQYNELLSAIYEYKRNNGKPVKSEEEKALDVKQSKYRLVYWFIFLAALIVRGVFNCPMAIYNAILLGNISFFFVYTGIYLVKVKKIREKNPSNNIDETKKNELYEELCKARSLYNSLKKDREVLLGKLSQDDYTQYMNYIESIKPSDVLLEEVKELELKNKGDING